MSPIQEEKIRNRSIRLGVLLGSLLLLTLGTMSAPDVATAVPVPESRSLDLLWERTWGGPNFDRGEGVAVAPDGSVYLTGQTNSFGTGVADGDLDVFLIKYSPAGAIVWQRTYGNGRTEPFLSASEFAADVEVGTDGSVYVAGSSNAGVLLVKFDPNGNVIWEQTFGDGSQSAFGMGLAPDGSIYLAGFIFPGVGQGDALLMKFAPDGTPVWQRTWGGNGFDVADDVAIASDGSVYVAGDNNSFFANDAFLVKFASDGTVIWQRDWRVGGIQNISASHGVAVAPDQSVYITGRAEVSGVGTNALLVKFTPDGSIIWERTWGGGSDVALGIGVAPSGLVYITGNTGFGAGGGDAFVVEFLSDGRARIALTWGGTDNESAQDIAVGADGGLYVAAVTMSPPPYEFRQASKKAKTPTSFLGVPTGIVTTPVEPFADPNGIVLTPNGSQTFAGAIDAAVLRISPSRVHLAASIELIDPTDVAASNIVPEGGGEALPANGTLSLLEQISPNPARALMSIRYRLPTAGGVLLQVLDVHGRVVETLVQEHQHPGLHEASWKSGAQGQRAPGVYFGRLEFTSIGAAEGDAGSKRVESRRLILLP